MFRRTHMSHKNRGGLANYIEISTFRWSYYIAYIALTLSQQRYQ